MRAHGVLSDVLRILAGRDPSPAPSAHPPGALTWLVRSGLGPLVRHLESGSRLTVPPAWRAPLRAADLVARMHAGALRCTAEDVVGRLRRAGIPSTLLKGIATARYYPEPHLRVMGDVDLLVPGEAIGEAVRLLLAEGFVRSTFAEPEWWDTHHHAPPLTHPRTDVTVELHRALLPPSAPAAGDPPFDPEALQRRSVDACLGREPVGHLIPECELALLAAAWSNDLSTALGRPGLQRPLVDAVLLLSATGDAFDWELLAEWTLGTATGEALLILLARLDADGVLPPEASALLRRLRADPLAPSSGVERAVHRIVRRHALEGRPFGRLRTRDNTARALGALLTRGPGWRRWVGAARDVLFPPDQPRRFEPGFHWRRLRLLLGFR